jgi:histidine triad (HIT) family protein
MLEVPSELGTHVFAALQKVAAAVMKATGAMGFNVMQNNGLAAGQTVFHIHWHIIPRFEDDSLKMWEQGSYADAAAMQEMAARVASYLEN